MYVCVFVCVCSWHSFIISLFCSYSLTRMDFLFPFQRLTAICQKRGLPLFIGQTLRLANLYNQHIGSTSPTGARGALLFLVCSNMLWCCIQMLSNLATDPKHQVLTGCSSTWPGFSFWTYSMQVVVGCFTGRVCQFVFGGPVTKLP